MEVPQSHGNLCDKEACLIFAEPFHFDKMSEQFTALDELHDEINAEVILEDVLHVNDERVINLKKDVLLKLNVFELLILYNYILSDALHGKYLLVLLILHQVNFSKGALANHLQDHKVLQPGLSES